MQTILLMPCKEVVDLKMILSEEVGIDALDQRLSAGFSDVHIYYSNILGMIFYCYEQSSLIV